MKKLNFVFLILIFVMVISAVALTIIGNKKNGTVLGEMNMATENTAITYGGIKIENVTTDILKVGTMATFKAKITNNSLTSFTVSNIIFKVQRTGDDLMLCEPTLTTSNKTIVAGAEQTYLCTWKPTTAGDIAVTLRINWNNNYTLTKTMTVAANTPTTAVTATNTTDTVLTVGQPATLKAKITNTTATDFTVSKLEFKKGTEVLCAATIDAINQTVAKNTGVNQYSCVWPEPKPAGAAMIDVYLNDKKEDSDSFTIEPAMPIDNKITVTNITDKTLIIDKAAELKAKITNTTATDFIVSKLEFKKGTEVLCAVIITDTNKTVAKTDGIKEYTCGTWTPTTAGAVTIDVYVNDEKEDTDSFTVLAKNEIKVVNVTPADLKVGVKAKLELQVLNTKNNDLKVEKIGFSNGDKELCSYVPTAPVTVEKDGGVKKYYCEWTPETAGKITIKAWVKPVEDDVVYGEIKDFNVITAPAADKITIENTTEGNLEVGKLATLTAKITNNTKSKFTVSKLVFKIQLPDPKPDKELCRVKFTSNANNPYNYRYIAKGETREYYCNWTPKKDTPVNKDGKLEITIRVNDKYTVVKTFDLAAGKDFSTMIKEQVALLIDTDKDGLDDTEEGWWKTDPTKTDSDGDNYDDYDEITTCHNPLDKNATKLACSKKATNYYGKMPLSSLSAASGDYYATIEQTLAKDLKDKLIALGVETKTANNLVDNLVRAYIYGRYVPAEIADAISRVCVIHPTIPANEWRESDDYQKCLAK